MSSKYYDGTNHIFYSETGPDVTIKAKSGQTLTFEGSLSASVGSPTDIIYNDAGTLTGSPNFTYDGTDVFLAGNLETSHLVGAEYSDQLGHNEIYRGIDPQTVVSPDTVYSRNLGNDVCMSKGSNTVVYACPYPTPGSGGAISVWSESGGTFSYYDDSLLNSNISNTNVKFCAINEDGDLTACVSGDLGFGNMTTFTLDGLGMWNYAGDLGSVSAMRISNDRVFLYDYLSNFKTYIRFAGTWAPESSIQLNDLPVDRNLDYPIAIDNTTLAFSYGSITKVFKYTSSWALSATLSYASIDMDYCANVCVLLQTSAIRIFENEVLIRTISVANGVHITTNGTYIFVVTSSSVIKIYSKIDGIWSKSVNDYQALGNGKMSANADYLSMGVPTLGTYGTAFIWKIEPYADAPFLIGNDIDLITNEDINISSENGNVQINTDNTARAQITNEGNTEIYGNLTVNGSSSAPSAGVSSGSLVCLGGIGVTKNINIGSSFTSSYNSGVMGELLLVNSATVQITSNGGQHHGAYFYGPTFTSSVAGAGLNNPATLYIGEAPVAGTGVTFNSGPWSLRVRARSFFDSTVAATSYQNGSLVVMGGISLGNSTDAVDHLNGGTLTTAGGMAIEKSLYVGLKIDTPVLVVSGKSSYTQTPSAVSPVAVTSSSGFITTVSLSMASGAGLSFAITSSLITASSLVSLTIDTYSGALVTNGVPFLSVSGYGAGTVNVTVSNVGVNNINGTIKFNYIIL